MEDTAVQRIFRFGKDWYSTIRADLTLSEYSYYLEQAIMADQEIADIFNQSRANLSEYQLYHYEPTTQDINPLYVLPYQLTLFGAFNKLMQYVRNQSDPLKTCDYMRDLCWSIRLASDTEIFLVCKPYMLEK